MSEIEVVEGVSAWLVTVAVALGFAIAHTREKVVRLEEWVRLRERDERRRELAKPTPPDPTDAEKTVELRPERWPDS